MGTEHRSWSIGWVRISHARYGRGVIIKDGETVWTLNGGGEATELVGANLRPGDLHPMAESEGGRSTRVYSEREFSRSHV